MKRGSIALLCVTLASAPAEEPWQAVDPVPPRFPVRQDRLGYSWQLTSAGSFYSSGGNVFDSANQLAIHGERFQVDRVETRLGHHAFTGRCGADWKVRREVWIDHDRAAACHLEEVSNASDRARPLVLEISTRFRTAWRSWTAFDGKARVWSALQPSTGAFLSFAPRDGDSDLFLLLGDGAALQPSILTNGQDFTVRFEVELAAGAQLRLFHAVGQRRSPPGMPPVEEPFAGWFSAGRLVLPRVSGALANFEGPATAESGNSVWTLRGGQRRVVSDPGRETLVLRGALGTIRLAAEEIAGFDGRVWTTREGYRFAAVPEPGQTVALVASSGERIGIPLEELAAIHVSGVVGAEPEGLRLKNGDVWPGKPSGESSGTEFSVGWEVQGTVREVPRQWLMEKGTR